MRRVRSPLAFAQFSQPQRISGRMSAGVVVEIHIHWHPLISIADAPLRPRFEHAIGITPCISLRTVQAKIRERPNDTPASGGSRHVVRAERYPMSVQHLKRLVAVPARLAKLDRVPSTRGQRAQKCVEAFEIQRPPRRKLVKHRTELRPKLSRAREQQFHRRPRILQFLHMREIPARLYGVDEGSRHAAAPLREGVAFGEPVERIVDFNRLESACVVFQPARGWQIRRIDRALPVLVLPSGAANSNNRCRLTNRDPPVPPLRSLPHSCLDQRERSPPSGMALHFERFSFGLIVGNEEVLNLGDQVLAQVL